MQINGSKGKFEVFSFGGKEDIMTKSTPKFTPGNTISLDNKISPVDIDLKLHTPQRLHKRSFANQRLITPKNENHVFHHPLCSSKTTYIE